MKGPEMTKHVRGLLTGLVKDESGPTAAEYAILLAMLVLVAMVAIGGIGSRVLNVYQAIEDAVSFFA
jgi:Flp pilus assembly pilin Flp